jgi:hypothetical protein
MMSSRCYIPTMQKMDQRRYWLVQVKRGLRFELLRRNWKSSLISRRSINSWVGERESSRVAGGMVSLDLTMQTLRTHQCSTKNQRKRRISINLKKTRSITTDFKVSFLFIIYNSHELTLILNSFRVENHTWYFYLDPCWN